MTDEEVNGERGEKVTTTRREFIATSGTALAVAGFGSGIVCAPAIVGLRRVHDTVIRNGRVFDGMGGPYIEADVAISGGRIVDVAATIVERGTEEIDARNLAVAPGFIDIHSHGDGNMEEDPRQAKVARRATFN